MPGSKMKCNALECLLKIQAQKGVANEKVPSINSMGKNKDSDVKAIGVLINEDCRSAHQLPSHVRSDAISLHQESIGQIQHSPWPYPEKSVAVYWIMIKP